MLEKLSVMDQSVHSLMFFIAFLISFVTRGLKEARWSFDLLRDPASNSKIVQSWTEASTPSHLSSFSLAHSQLAAKKRFSETTI